MLDTETKLDPREADARAFTAGMDEFGVRKVGRQHQDENLAAFERIAVTTSWTILGLVFQWARAGRKIQATQLSEQNLALLTPGLQNYLVDD